MNNLPSGNQTYPLEINHGKLGNPLGIFKLVNGKTSMNGASPLPCLTTRFQCKLFREPAYPRCLVQDCEFQIITPTELHEHTHSQGQLCHTFASFVHHAWGISTGPSAVIPL